MREGLGSIFLYNLIILFILIVFAFLVGTMSYAKAFRVNSKITKVLEKYEGYNHLADAEITNVLKTLGYVSAPAKCEKFRNLTPLNKISNEHDYCLYEERDANDKRHITIGVLTYMYLDLPLVNAFKIPIYSRTERIFCFRVNNDTCIH